ncbi:MAG: DUF4389 domain-containing protein [Gammaproteobacteria bacterium]
MLAGQGAMGEETSWTDHILNGETWLRFLVMLLYTPLLACVGFLIACIALFQFFAMLASGESNAELRALGRDLSRLAMDIADFLTCNTERRPFPFQSGAWEYARETDAPYATRREASEAASVAPQPGEEVSSRFPPAPRRTTSVRRKRTPRKKKTTARRRPASTRKKHGASSVKPARPDEVGPVPEQSQGDETSDSAGDTERHE